MLIHWAALGGHEELVKLLSDLGSPIDSKDDVRGLLHPRIYLGHCIFLFYDPFQIGSTPLILSSSAGKEQVVHTLLSLGAQVNSQNHEGHSALQYAASKGWLTVSTKSTLTLIKL